VEPETGLAGLSTCAAEMEVMPMFLGFFNLREQPFGVTPDPAYLYPSRTHCEALDSLTEAILGDRGFLALIAEPGMGKTTLLYQVLEGLRDSARAVFLFQTQCNSREFFQYLMSELGVDSTGMGIVAMHNKLNELLFAEMLAGRRFVLIVDEAQNLDDSVLETIRMLSNFETPHAKLLQIVLAGQPQLGEKLGHPSLSQLLQRITTVKYLESLSPEETAGYIEHRLKVAGYRGPALFEPEALALVAERSSGVPRIVNRMCFRAMLEAYARGRQTVSAEMVEKADRQLEVRKTAPSVGPSMAAPVEVPVPALLQPLVSAAPVVESHVPEPSLQLSYKPRTESGKPRWSLGAAGLVVLLLSAGLALPHIALKVTMQNMREQMAATKNIVQRETGASGQQTPLPGAATTEIAANPARPDGRGTPSVTAIQASSAENDAQIVVLLDEPVQYDSARLDSPDRIYFDLHKTRLGPSVGQKTVPGETGLLKSVRAAQNSDEVVRLVLEADGAKEYSAQLLTDPYRLVIDVHADPPARSNHAAGSDATKQTIGLTIAKETGRMGNQLSLTRELGLKINRIVIDPGHGGYDTGTTGPRGLLEKSLCLDVALRLGQLIEQNIPGAKVVYTRKDDRHVPLEERTAMANEANADMFISIHANSSSRREIRGVETYYMSLAATREASELAARENAFGQSSLHDLPGLLKKITNSDKIAESKQLAGEIQNALSQRLQLVNRQEVNRGVKRAPFLVLTGANMPAVLSEISFVSNASDENLLFEGSQRQHVAEGLYRGIASYLGSLHSLPQKKQKFVSEARTTASSGPGF
jgi:N-acetylmuramoyl-L-alanine amidase/type II secretory pathway predicted ATPase ExeA